MAAIITAVLVAAVALFFTPLLETLPKSALAAIIIVAVSRLIDPRAIVNTWRFDRVDGLVLLATALGVPAILLAIYVSRKHDKVVGIDGSP